MGVCVCVCVCVCVRVRVCVFVRYFRHHFQTVEVSHETELTQ